MLFSPESPTALVLDIHFRPHPCLSFLCFLTRVEGCRTAFESISIGVTAVRGISVVLTAVLTCSTPFPCIASPIAYRLIFFLVFLILCSCDPRLLHPYSVRRSDIFASCYHELLAKRMRFFTCAKPMPTGHWLVPQCCASIQLQADRIPS